MKKSERLQFIIDIQMQQEKQALEALGVCRQKQQALIQQLQNLQSYRQEYKEKNDDFENQSVTIGQLLEFRAFINKLDKAIEEQQKIIETKNKELSVCLKTWEQKHQKSKNLQKVGDMAASEEIRLEHKREQAEQDDRASRMGRRTGIGNA